MDEPFLFKAVFQPESGFFQIPVGSDIIHTDIGFDADHLHVMERKITYSLYTSGIDHAVPIFAFQKVADGAGRVNGNGPWLYSFKAFAEPV